MKHERDQQSSRKLEAAQAKRCRIVLTELLDGYSSALKRGLPPQEIPVACIREAETTKALLDGFVSRRESSQQHEIAEAKDRRIVLTDFLDGYSSAVKQWRTSQVERADEFNMLDVMQLAANEIRHSMVLAWLLDWDIAHLGTHAQGECGLKRFLIELDLDRTPCFKGKLAPYTVYREVSDSESRLDIQVAAPGRFLIGIEVKIWAKEGLHQTGREWKDLEERAKALHIPNERSLFAFLLTPDGAKAKNDNFRPITWRQLAKVFRDFSDEARPPEVKLFAKHYARALQRF